jgi:hypothetical protein
MCLTCFPGGILSSNNTCIMCSSNCATCSSTNSQFCTSCPTGQILNNGACNVPNNNSTNCGAACSSCSIVGNAPMCTICMYGWVLNNGSCNPCQAGCAVCSNNNFNLCQLYWRMQFLHV